MTRKSIVLLLVALLALVLPASATLAQVEPSCNPALQDTCSAELGDQLVISWGWAACSKGLVKNFLKTIYEHKYTLTAPDGTTEVWSLGTEAAQDLWGPIQEWPDTDFCMGNVPTAWSSMWESPAGTLNMVGDYSLHFVLSLKHPVPDGGDLDDDGHPDIYTGWDRTVTITVN